MKTKPNLLITFLSISIILLTCADRAAAAARNIIVEGSGVTVTVSSLNSPIPLSSADTILVRNGGTLFVDASATVGTLNIGDASTPGNVLFDSVTSHTLTVTGDIPFGGSSLNVFDMTLTTAHTLLIGGNFLASGAGTFRAGSSTIQYNSPTAQAVTATVGNTGAFIQYKNLVLSGSPATGLATKNFANGVSVQGALTIKEKAIPSGGSVNYGALATLVYNCGTNQFTTPTEWPATLGVPVTIDITSAYVLTLDGDKTLGAVAPNSLTLLTGMLNDGGHTLTVQGNILNGFQSTTALLGTGKLVLAGTGPQALTGVGNYGNLVLNNNATSSLPVLSGSPLTQPLINGRLTIQSGSKLALASGSSHQTALLTYGGADKPAVSYGSTASSATTKDNTVFDSNFTGILIVNPKPAAVVSQTLSTNGISYGDASITISGTVTPPPTSPNFALYGNAAQGGEVISNAVYNSANVLVRSNLTTVDGTGAYGLILNTSTLSQGTYTVISSYKGGINLNPADSAGATLTVNKKQITVTPDNVSKTYGQSDPPLTYSWTPALVGSDAFTGALSRANPTSENVGTYAILQNTLDLSANYTISFVGTKTLTILAKTIDVSFVAQAITYGQSDPPFNRSNIDYTISPQLIAGDSFIAGTALTRAQAGTPAGQNVGQYAISLGTLSAGPNYVLHPANSANLTINQLAITVNFTSTSKAYGAVDPTFAFIPTPALPFGDAFTGAASRDPGETVAGGPYTIRQGTLSLGTKAGNYSVTYSTTGKLTINKVDVSVAAIASQPKLYGAAVPPLVTYTGFLTGNPRVPDQSVPATLPTLNQAGMLIAQCSLPGISNYSITSPGSDPNYNMVNGTPLAGIVNIGKAPLTITAVNQTKVADGGPFPTGNYTVSYNSFSAACGDTVANSLSGTLAFTGPAIAATAPGVYAINVAGQTSAKYDLTYVSGSLTLTAPPSTVTNATVTWTGPSGAGDPTKTTSLAFAINQANGTAGANPGWSLQVVTGTLTISASSSDKFIVNMVTLAGNSAGLMAKFDPTRPYSWEIVRAGNIVGFDASNNGLNQITLSYLAAANGGANPFLNPLFNGVFSVSQTGNSLFLNFTPMGSTGGFASGGGYKVAVPPGYDVGTTTNDTTKLLGYTANHDVPLLYLSPSATTVSPQSPVTINLNVANLQGLAIVGVDAYINFDSRFFVATTGAGAPVVAAGGGVWNNLITKSWNVGGDLDTVVAVGLTATTGTSADGTVATIVLTPTRTAVGTSRVVFRHDGDPKLDGTGPLTTDIVPSAANAAAVLPGRVMTDEITVSGAGVAPVIGTITATQVQPLVGSVPNPINVKNGTAASRTQTVRTSNGILGSYPDDTSTASGPVVITINASDAGVGLSGPPTLVLSNTPANMVTVPCTTPNATVGPFVYNWSVPAGAAQGTWTAVVTASDTLIPPTVTTVGNAFTLVVNTTEVSGVVELQGLLAANRLVTFNSGGGSGASNQWDMTLNFVGGDLLSAGAFQDVTSFAAVVNDPQDPVSVGLRYGTILNLQTLAFNLANQVGGVSAYIYGLEYGSIANLQALANQLTNPQRPVDTYVVSQLSQATIVALATYQSSHGANAAALTKDLLNDFNNIVLGPNIYDPVRFAGVCVTHPTSGTDTVAVNRGLLEDAYVQTCTPYLANYVPGKLQAETAQALSNYGGGSDPALAADILADFDTLTLTPSLWPTPNVVPYDQGLYNQKIFLGVTLSSATEALLTSQPPVTGTSLTLLNQDLLQDAYPGQYQKAPLTPATVVAAQQYNPSNPASVQAFVSDVTTDLNALINSGTRIYTPVPGSYNPNSELGQLLNMSSLTPDQQIRENRLLLELEYPEQLTQNSVNSYPEAGLATFRLVQVPAIATQLSAKTAWNLRVTRPVAGTVNFVGNGVPGAFTPASDFYLRAGDMNGDNVVNLLDYNILRINFGTTAGGPADINGDGVVNIFDYTLLQNNFGKSGDPAVQ